MLYSKELCPTSSCCALSKLPDVLSTKTSVNFLSALAGAGSLACIRSKVALRLLAAGSKIQPRYSNSVITSILNTDIILIHATLGPTLYMEHWRHSMRRRPDYAKKRHLAIFFTLASSVRDLANIWLIMLIILARV